MIMEQIIIEQTITEQITKLEMEMHNNLKLIKNDYLAKINSLKNKQKQQEFQSETNKLSQLILVDNKTEFNEWWNLWLKLYDRVYKSIDNKYYYIKL
jgi:hypothetical protein